MQGSDAGEVGDGAGDAAHVDGFGIFIERLMLSTILSGARGGENVGREL